MKNKREKTPKPKKTKVVKVGTHKVSRRILWAVLLGSVAFGVYKNFTAIDTHTVHEVQVIETQYIDTNHVESFVTGFAKAYYTWGTSREAIDSRIAEIGGYMTDDLVRLNMDTVRPDIPTASSVRSVQVWNVRDLSDGNFQVLFSVEQDIDKTVVREGEDGEITEQKTSEAVESFYTVGIYADESGGMVITKNPTISGAFTKSGYTPQRKDSGGSVNADTSDEISEFLVSFFSMYPSASDKELVYYVRNDALRPILQDYVFAELVSPVYTDQGDTISADITVRYLDKKTNLIQLSQYELQLVKDGNWVIVGCK